MSRVRAADDFEAIRLRLEELRRDRVQQYAGASPVRSSKPDPDAAARRPSPTIRRILSEARRSSAR
jgi:hypothetical protein